MEKLFYKDIHVTDFQAKVTECIFDEERKQYKIALDRTAFFPEEGGQTADKGFFLISPETDSSMSHGNRENTISTSAQKLEVSDVQTKADTIWHYTDSPLPVEQMVTGHVDWAQRFDFMQQHSGEHILSGLIHKYYGYDNVGFHLGLTEVTMDFNGSLSLEQLRRIEREANEAVWADIPIRTFFPTPRELSEMTYRSKLDLTENVRIVEIPGIDSCACCAPHVDTTGRIGLIKIVNVQSHRGGVRINILCGGRALADYTARQDAVTGVSVLLSAKQDSIVPAVSRLMEESALHKERANALQAELLSQKILSLPSPSETENVTLFVGDLDTIAMRNAVNALTQQYGGFCSIFAGDDKNGYRYVIGSRQKDCREIAASLTQRFQSKGGGTAPMIQGSIAAPKDDILAFMES